MQEKQVPVMDYRTRYFSDDGCRSSFNKEDIEQYENALKTSISEPQLIAEDLILEIEFDHYYYWDIYYCENKEAFNKLLSKLSSRTTFIRCKEAVFADLQIEYSSDCKYYGARIDDCGDDDNIVAICKITDLYQDVIVDIEERVKKLKEDINCLTKSKEYLENLIGKEE